MNFLRLLLTLTATLGLLLFSAPAQQNPPASGLGAELETLVERIRLKVATGATSETDLAPEIAGFDALLAKHKGGKTDEAAQVLFMKASLYSEILENHEKALALVRQLKAGFPDTGPGRDADQMIASIEERARITSARAALIGKPAPALNFVWASRAGLKTLADLKGKVVVLDFWATWCGPCISLFPEVRKLTAHYEGCAVEVVGVAGVDNRGDPTKEIRRLPSFIKQMNMTWTVAFSREEVFNPDYTIESIPYMAILAPDGTLRFMGSPQGMSYEAKLVKIDALLKEFSLKLPAKS